MRFRNICANLLPRQIANQYDEDTVETIVEVQITNEKANDGVIRPTIVVIHDDNTSDTFRWQDNPHKGEPLRGTNMIDHRPSVWVQVEVGVEVEAA
jgi:hypothetical protein